MKSLLFIFLHKWKTDIPVGKSVTTKEASSDSLNTGTWWGWSVSGEGRNVELVCLAIANEKATLNRRALMLALWSAAFCPLSLLHLKKVCLHLLSSISSFKLVPTVNSSKRKKIRQEFQASSPGREKKEAGLYVHLLCRNMHRVVWHEGSGVCGLDTDFVAACFYLGDFEVLCS